MFGSFLRAYGRHTTTVYSGRGADIVMQSCSYQYFSSKLNWLVCRPGELCVHELLDSRQNLGCILPFVGVRFCRVPGNIGKQQSPCPRILPCSSQRQLLRLASSVLARTLDHASMADGFQECWSGSSGGVGFDRALHAAAVAQLAQCAVPKFDAGFDTAAGRTQSPFTRMR